MTTITLPRAVVEQALALIASARLCEVNSMSSRQEMLRLLIEATDILRAALAQQAEPVEPVAHRVVAGALFDFMGWLTSRRERLVLSSTDDAAPAADAIKDFAEMRGLSLDDAKVQDWNAALAQQAEPVHLTSLSIRAQSTIGRWLNEDMDRAVANGANLISMPDELVEIAAWLHAQAEPVEPVDVGLLEYRGNSVAFIHQKMTAYRTGIDVAWDAFRAKGLHPDGKTSLADMIAKYTAPPQQVTPSMAEIQRLRAERDALAERLREVRALLADTTDAYRRQAVAQAWANKTAPAPACPDCHGIGYDASGQTCACQENPSF